MVAGGVEPRSPIKNPTSVCSPVSPKAAQQGNFCFSKVAIKNMLDQTRLRGHYPKDASIEELWKLLQGQFADVCAGKKNVPGCIAKNLNMGHEFVKAEMPADWKENPKKWLTNIDIEEVMKRYAAQRDYHYNFLGVFPIDFAEMDKLNQCIVSEWCHLKWSNLTKGGAKFVGLITNLDKHDEPGSHWTSLFMCLDPRLPSYGAYYYDSGRSAPPAEMNTFMQKLKAMADEKHKGKSKTRFQLQWNKIKQHQFKNTECGIFAMLYQIRWLEELKKNPKVTFEAIVNVNWDDEFANAERQNLYVTSGGAARRSGKSGKGVKGEKGVNVIKLIKHKRS